MKRKLIALNVVLVALVAAAAWRLRVEWTQARQHEGEVLQGKPRPAQPPVYVPMDTPKPLVAGQYFDVAGKDLFSRDRNPTVVIPTPTPPPPPPPMPKLPVLRGMMNIGGVSAIMSEDPKAIPKEYKPGDKIGEFTLVALSTQEVVLEWNGETVRKSPQELMDHSIPEQATAAPPAAGAGSKQIAPPQTQIRSAGPGQDMGAGRKACITGDSTAVGTVVDGFRKVSWETPFGTGCAWEAAK